MKQITLAAYGMLAALAPLQAQAATIAFSVGDRDFTVPAPAGFCEPTGKDRGIAQVIASADSQNVTLVTLVPCGHAEGTPMTDYFLVKTPVRSVMMDMDREELLTLLAAQLKGQGNTLSESSAKTASDGISNATGRPVTLGGEYHMVGRTGACLEMAGTMTFTLPGGTMDVDTASCLTGIGGKFLAVHRYNLHDGGKGFPAMLASTRSLAGSIQPAP